MEFRFDTPAAGDSLVVELAMLPSHPIDGKALAMTVSINGSEPQTVDYATQGQRENWKQNILRGQAVRRLTFKPDASNRNSITLTPLSEGIVLDRVLIYGKH